jgi:hypothetical protein
MIIEEKDGSICTFAFPLLHKYSFEGGIQVFDTHWLMLYFNKVLVTK